MLTLPNRKSKPKLIVDTMPEIQRVGLTRDELIALKDRYKEFLLDKKMAGSGLTTRSATKQDRRSENISHIDQCFEELIQTQTVQKWEALLIRLVQYRIQLYTENSKTNSTFGDALHAVHIHLLQTLKLAYIKSSNCAILCKINDEMSNPSNALEGSFKDLAAWEEMRIRSAAFGYNHALKNDIIPNIKKTRTRIIFSLSKEQSPICYPPALIEPSKQMADFLEQINAKRYESYLDYGEFFSEPRKETEGENPDTKKRRASIS